MKHGAALALILAALSWPALAQQGFARGGSLGNRGFAGHGSFPARPGFSARSGFSARPGFFARPAFSTPGNFAPSAPFRYGSFARPATGRLMAPHPSNFRLARGRNSFPASRPLYRPGFGRSSYRHRNGWGHGRDRDGDHDGDRDRFRGRARSFQSWYLFDYPVWLGYAYPFDLDPGFFDWSDYDNSGYDQNNQASGYNNQAPGYQQESPNGGYAEPGGPDYGEPGQQPQPWPEPGAPESAPENQPSMAAPIAASALPLDAQLTVIFKDGRAPEKMQNYMLTAKSLTDLDAGRYQQIPLDRIDVAATARANRANGLQFQIPGASGD